MPWVGVMSNGFTSIRRIAWRAGSPVPLSVCPSVRLSVLHVHVKVMDENEFRARDPMQHPLQPRALGAACVSVGMWGLGCLGCCLAWAGIVSWLSSSVQGVGTRAASGMTFALGI